jgi:hypothetical protein
VRRVKLFIGEELEDIDSSQERAFAICKKNGWPLRVTFFKEAAKMWKSDTTKVCACKISLL